MDQKSLKLKVSFKNKVKFKSINIQAIISGVKECLATLNITWR